MLSGMSMLLRHSSSFFSYSLSAIKLVVFCASTNLWADTPVLLAEGKETDLIAEHITPKNVDFETVNRHVLQRVCIRCHSLALEEGSSVLRFAIGQSPAVLDSNKQIIADYMLYKNDFGIAFLQKASGQQTHPVEGTVRTTTVEYALLINYVLSTLINPISEVSE